MRWFSSYGHGKLGEHKAWEWQTDYFGWNRIFNLDIDLIPTGYDHAGVGFSLTILGFMVDAKIYDSRHWDDENGTWEKYDEDSMLERENRWERERVHRLEEAYRLVKEDGNKQALKSAEEFLESPRGQALIDRKVKEKLAEQRQSKQAKIARGAEYRARNRSGGTQEI